MPVALLSLLSGLKSFLGAVLTFFSKPPGSYVLCVLLAAGAWWYSGHLGYGRGQADCEAAHKTAAREEQARQAVVSAKVVLTSEIRTNLSFGAEKQDRAAIAKIKEDAHAAPDANAVCVSASMADRLRDLSRGSEAGFTPDPGGTGPLH